MKNEIELLAPAGSYDAFLAAVENGANAVYLGGKLFNARANASNFDIDELQKIVEYAHLRNVKINLTMNTLLDDDELEKALEFAYEIYKIGVDAVIVQDLGLAKILHKYLPDLPLHASTQLTTHNLEGVQALAKLGFSRVVLARELSLEEIKEICENTDTEIEIFAHGALCVSYSGQCLMSSMIGDRSGNRGKCAQPCRMPYQLLKDSHTVGSGYLLSPKDLSTLEILNKLPNIACLKIEGRMKSPEYVATVTRIYRKYLDNINTSVEPQDSNDLVQIFNRGGFSKAYLLQKTGKDMMCYEKPKNWGTYVGKVINYDGKRYITLDNTSSLQIGDGIEVWNNTNNSPSTIVSELIGNKVGRIHGEINIGNKVYKTSDKTLNQRARESFSRGFQRHSPINVKITIEESKPIIVEIEDFKYTYSILPEKAQKQPLDEEKIKAQFLKTGNTPFSINTLTIQLGNELFLPISTLNELRRQSLEAYEQHLLSKMERRIESRELTRISDTASNKTNAPREVSLWIQQFKNEYPKLKNVDNFYFSLRDAFTHIEEISQFPGKKYIVFPTITKANYAKLISKKLSALAKKIDGFVLSNIGQLEYFNNFTNRPTLIANYTFNTFNSYTIELLKDLGFSKVILSPELAKFQINTLTNLDIQKEIFAYGNLCVMTSEYCPVGSVLGGLDTHTKCSMPCTKDSKYYLKDRMNMEFRVLPDNIDCQSRIFNAKTTSIETKDFNISSVLISILDENINEVQHIVDTHRKGQKLSGEKYTNGHLNRPV